MSNTWISKLVEAGAYIHDGLQIQDFPDTGRGIATSSKLKHRERILHIPAHLTWSIDSARADSKIGHLITDEVSINDAIALLLLHHRSKYLAAEKDDEEALDWRMLHLKHLPKEYSSTLTFDSDELAILEGSVVYSTTKLLEDQIANDYEVLSRTVLCHKDLFPPSCCALVDYKWALLTVYSRCMDNVNREKDRRMAPFADMFNHSEESEAVHMVDETGITVFASRDYESGQQVYISYGRFGNEKMLWVYGFIIENNLRDSYPLVLHTNEEADLYNVKSDLWKQANLTPTSTIPLTMSNPLPVEILQYLRIQRFRPEVYATSRSQPPFRQLVSYETEHSILADLKSAFQGLLQEFRPRDELQRISESGAKFTKRWMAAVTASSQYNILVKSLEKVEREMEVLQCGNCGKVDDQNKYCSRCLKVLYCSRECQKKAYKEHKKTCVAP
ncbi:hypothetical protein SmJEL517_g04397 [Synchytrium microbalum]|uniref:MYND-type domain-containing protein n=1 Tax=Synchytrium microbalum TaxID=1806994 RepID=A0A507C4T4_9FUNG|nr:uncharacterized protein SmJEL517_g04397 [Synchytrium microbalum]TPX32543.1 hypothetical protein SmJEL517_g04397 [Synchytrium microbalum]